jgi:hypothetical protein
MDGAVMNTDKLAKHVARLRSKVAKTQTELRVLSDELLRAEARHRLALDSSKIAAGKRG